MMMDHALIEVGLPVKCRKCRKEGRVRPNTNYDGWYKSKFFRLKRYKWFCTEHYELGREIDNRFYENHKTPDPYPEEETPERIEEELYALLD